MSQGASWSAPWEATQSSIPVVMVVAVVPRMDPQHTTDTADHAARDTTDDTAHGTTDRSEHTIAGPRTFAGADVRTLRDALRHNWRGRQDDKR
jgi:hypothetical protein